MIKRTAITEQTAADALAALGNPTRLRIFKILIRAGHDGINVGSVQRLLAIPATTLAHHLNMLASAALIAQQKRGREVICTANYMAVDEVLNFVKAECCTGVASSGGKAA